MSKECWPAYASAEKLLVEHLLVYITAAMPSKLESNLRNGELLDHPLLVHPSAVILQAAD